MRKITLSDSEPNPILSHSETPPHIRRRFWWISLGSMLPLVALGLFLAIKEGTMFYQSTQSPNWPQVTGKVLEASTSPISGDRWKTHIRYQYEVEGTLYESTRPQFVERRFGSQAMAERFISAYPVDQEIPVFYHPQKPRVSVLKTGTESALLPLFAIGLSLAGGAMVSIFLLVRRLERRYHEKQLKAKTQSGHNASR